MALSNEDMAAAGWMAEARNDPQIEHLLNEVGRSLLGEQSDWCTDPAKLSKLADVLGSQGTAMFELHQMTNRQEQVEWLEMVVATTQGAQEAAQETYEESGARAAESGRYSAPVYDEGYQLYYRFDNEGSVYEWCTNPHVASPEWMSQSAADAMVAQRVPQEAAEQTGSGGQVQVAEPAWAWDDGWGMFYRIGAGSVYEYSHSVDDAHTRPDGVWLSGEQVLQQRQQGEVAETGQPGPVEASGGTVQGEHGAGAREEGERGEPASSAVSVEPLDLESALGVFERAGVSELREVVEDVEALFAELSRLGVA